MLCATQILSSQIFTKVVAFTAFLTRVVLYDFAAKLSEHLTPNTSAYHEIWLDKKQVGGEAIQDFEPLYGPTYLPRKFKIGIAIPPHNDVDIYTQDIGFVAVVNGGELQGLNVLVGGGMGMTHNNKNTFPCLGQPLAFCRLDQAIDVAEKIMLVQSKNSVISSNLVRGKR